MSRRRGRVTSESARQSYALITPRARAFIGNQTDFIDYVRIVAARKRLKQSEIATALGKSPSEISKWMTMGHNLTMRTVAKLEAVLETPLLVTPLRQAARERAGADYGEAVDETYRELRERAEKRARTMLESDDQIERTTGSTIVREARLDLTISQLTEGVFGSPIDYATPPSLDEIVDANPTVESEQPSKTAFFQAA